jgi:hypothetical protein
VKLRSAALARATAVVILSACAVETALAQGHVHGPPPGHGHGARPGNAGGASPPVDRDPGPTGAAEFPARNFGTWADDTYVLDPGEAWVGAGIGYWRLAYADQIDAPTIDASVGLTPRVHLAATLPVSTLSYPDGFSDRYLGDAYISLKIGVRGAGTGIGLAVAPLVEILSDGSSLDAHGQAIGRVHWGLPINVEYRGIGWRVYGNAGYFSRGAAFASTTLDVSLGARAGALGMIGYTHSIAEPITFNTGARTARSRTDASGGGYARLSPSVSVYGLIGRTVSNQDAYTSRLSLSCGVSFRVSPPRRSIHASTSYAADHRRRH